ncbi:hypothetical protein ACFRCI_43725 [Streptomyces sp. NPDC056638]|uniref:hypothetical protein n=1 Tax=Streptomyces sp. NPDC056638 TaxID=3345887 RepID=UPI0036A077F6
MAHVPVLSSRPVRGFTWRAKQRHRPGLEVMASTGRGHGFESLEEMRLLVALDFVGASEVLSQPFRLDFQHGGGSSWHIPDYLAVIGGGMWLLDVRPMELIKDEDALKFAAAREMAAACGWRYSVVAGWRPTGLRTRARPGDPVAERMIDRTAQGSTPRARGRSPRSGQGQRTLTSALRGSDIFSAHNNETRLRRLPPDRIGRSVHEPSTDVMGRCPGREDTDQLPERAA